MFSTFGAFAAAFLMRPVGAIVLGVMATALAAARHWSCTIGLMAAATGFTGLIPPYQSIGISVPSP